MIKNLWHHPLARTLLSLMLYIGIYYILFKDLKNILLLVMVIIIHETGHFAAMKIYGYGNVKMLFIPLLGAFVSGQPKHIHPVKKMVILMSGPLPGILIGMFCAMMYSISHTYIYYQLALMFIFLNVFNLLPVSPLDGGQMLETLFFRTNRVVQTIFLALSSIVMLVLVLRTKNYVLVLIVVFLLMRIKLVWKKGDIENGVDEEVEEITLGYKGKAAFSILWLLFILMPMLALIRINS